MTADRLTELVALREHLVRETALHSEHLRPLQSTAAPGTFRAHPSETDAPDIWHLTTTATCIDSLLLCPDEVQRADARAFATEFAVRSVMRAPAGWASDGTATVYARVRALPLVIRNLPSPLSDAQVAALVSHRDFLREAVHKPGHYCVGEKPYGGKEYPPSAYHTYWYLETIAALRERQEAFAHRKESFASEDAFLTAALGWLRGQIGIQCTLHHAESSNYDPDALAWSVASLVRHAAAQENASPADRELIRAGVQTLFASQLPDGTWRQVRPLFHYPSFGSAYCFAYETVGILLRDALGSDQHWALAGYSLIEQLPGARRLIDNAARTVVRHRTTSGQTISGWLAEHRRGFGNEPDTWATASVYLFHQALRRAVGRWVRDLAARELKARRVPASSLTSRDTVAELLTRGSCWKLDERDPSVGESLRNLFVVPISTQSPREYDPDERAIDKDVSCSAILYGPPGTSKTSLAELVAASLGWDFVEIYASHFVNEGLPNVQRVADRIFEYVSQLDRAVVLFDEIDELVRERQQTPDAFGRFLTTSMLPKLAALWKQRRIVYMVATNYLEYFDSAIKRSQRFDALIYVPTPALDVKLAMLAAANFPFPADASSINEELRRSAAVKTADGGRLSSVEYALARLALLRWDEMPDLIQALNRTRGKAAGSGPLQPLRQALLDLSDPRFTQPARYADVVQGFLAQRRDLRMKDGA